MNPFYFLIAFVVCFFSAISFMAYNDRVEKVAKIQAGWFQVDGKWMPPENVKHEIDKTDK